jgi:hypothetical protein
MDRRTTLKWVLAAGATLPFAAHWSLGAEARTAASAANGYGTDPNLLKGYKPGDLWPLTLNAVQRRAATALSDLIIPADSQSPAASAVGVIDFIDEWISAPYPRHVGDREIVLYGLKYIDAEAKSRFRQDFAGLTQDQQRAICDEICYAPKVAAALTRPAKFFAVYRNLTAGGFYSTPLGRNDLRYVGNVPLARFDGPPLEVLKKVGLA